MKLTARVKEKFYYVKQKFPYDTKKFSYATVWKGCYTILLFEFLSRYREVSPPYTERGEKKITCHPKLRIENLAGKF